MRSGGGHYSAAIVPFLIVAAIYGVDWLAWAIGRLAKDRWSVERVMAYSTVALVLTLAGLVVALVHHYQNGISPLSRRFDLEPVTEHARRAEPFIEQVNSLPPRVPISASSSLYPHVGHRETVYLFPTISDAQFILLDVTGPPSPAGVGDMRQIVGELLDYGEFGVAASDHGFLLLERELDQIRLSPTFSEVFYAGDATPQVPVGADFGSLLRLEGFDVTPRSVVRPELVVEIATYWRALVPLEEDYRLVFYFWDKEDRLVRVIPEEYSLHWYPTWLWEPDQVIKITLPARPVGDLAYMGVAVLGPGVDNRDVDGRVVPIKSPSGQPLILWEQDTILELEKP
jgi:hypothetical protein